MRIIYITALVFIFLFAGFATEQATGGPVYQAIYTGICTKYQDPEIKSCSSYFLARVTYGRSKDDAIADCISSCAMGYLFDQTNGMTCRQKCLYWQSIEN